MPTCWHWVNMLARCSTCAAQLVQIEKLPTVKSVIYISATFMCQTVMASALGCLTVRPKLKAKWAGELLQIIMKHCLQLMWFGVTNLQNDHSRQKSNSNIVLQQLHWIPNEYRMESWPWARYLRLCASTKQYNLVLCTATGHHKYQGWLKFAAKAKCSSIQAVS